MGRGLREAEGGLQSAGGSGRPLASTKTRVRDWASEIFWSPSWTPKMTKAVPSTFFPYKNLRSEERLRFFPAENLSVSPNFHWPCEDPEPLASHLTLT